MLQEGCASQMRDYSTYPDETRSSKGQDGDDCTRMPSEAVQKRLEGVAARFRGVDDPVLLKIKTAIEQALLASLAPNGVENHER